MPTIYVQNICIPVASIKNATQVEDIPHFSELSTYFQSAIRFCHQWLMGEQAFEIHTSGSTGKPKPITIHRQQMQISAHMTLQTLKLQSTDTALVCLNADYIAGKMMLVRALEAGMDAVIAKPDSLPFAQVPQHIIIRFAAMVPMQVSAALESATLESAGYIQRFNQLKALLIGGAPVSYILEQKIAQQILAPVYMTYGMTETVSHIALRKIRDDQAYYQAVEGIHLATDDRSCLIIQGAVTNHEKLVTNDVVELIDAQHFRWIGRADHVINSGGYKVFPEKVEAKLHKVMQQAAIPNAFIVGSLPDERLGNKVVLLLEGNAPSADQQQKLWSLMREQLHPYELPKTIFYIPEFVMTKTGKVKRKATLLLIDTQAS